MLIAFSKKNLKILYALIPEPDTSIVIKNRLALYTNISLNIKQTFVKGGLESTYLQN